MQRLQTHDSKKKQNYITNLKLNHEKMCSNNSKDYDYDCFLKQSVPPTGQNAGKKTFYVCYIDLTKAFDYLNRDALIVKLQQRNVDGKFLNTIKSMFHKSSSRVKWNGKISKPINSVYGVMQGDLLSPKLFNEFIQDLRKYSNLKYGLKIGDLYLAYLLFAENLLAQIELFYKYCEIWNLIISIAKTKIVIYNQIYAKHSFSFTLGENALEIVDKYKYLGLWCSNNKKYICKKNIRIWLNKLGKQFSQ